MSLPTIPEGLDLLPQTDGVIIRKKWLSWKILPIAGFAVFWDGFLVFWYAQALTSHHVNMVAILFPLLHVAVGFFITYTVLASLVNCTDITISRVGVKVVHGPAPWLGNRDVKREEITQLIVRLRTQTRGSSSPQVMYVDPTRKERKLVTSLTEWDQADFVAKIIRGQYGLRDQEEE